MKCLEERRWTADRRQGFGHTEEASDVRKQELVKAIVTLPRGIEKFPEEGRQVQSRTLWMQLRCPSDTSVGRWHSCRVDQRSMMTKTAFVFPRMQSMSFHSSDIGANADRHRPQDRSGRSYNFALFKQSLGDQSENDEKALEEPETQNDEFYAKLALEKSVI